MFLTPRNLPQYTKIPPRQRYSTPKLLHFLSAHRGSATRIVGITDADITLPMNNIPDWGVFGAANYHSPSAMISRHRLRKNAHTSHTIDERLTRVVVHELGHTFGLPHCPTPRCLMNDAGGKIATIDQASDKFCAICRTKLSRHLPPQ